MLHFKGSNQGKNVPSSNSKIIKYEPIICSKCNNQTSQPWDKAYEKFEKWIFENSKLIFKNRFIPLELVYGGEQYSIQCSNLYKYFVKAFGCRLVSSGTSVPNDLRKLLTKKCFVTKLRLCFSINETSFALEPEDRDNFLGVGDLFRLNSKGLLNRYFWHLNIGWLTVWFFYDYEIPCGVGAPWVSDSACLYLGVFQSASIEQLIENAREQNNGLLLKRLEQIKSNGGFKIE